MFNKILDDERNRSSHVTAYTPVQEGALWYLNKKKKIASNGNQHGENASCLLSYGFICAWTLHTIYILYLEL